MSPKSSKNDTKKTPSQSNPFFDLVIDPRKVLLAQVAGSIAAGMMVDPSPSMASTDAIATAAVDIAEAILVQAEIPPSEASDEPGASA